MTIDVAFAHMADKAAAEGDMRKLNFIHMVPPQIVCFCISVIPVTLGCYFGSGVVTDMIHALEGRPLETLQVIGGLLPALGIAMNLRALDKPGIILWFILGFVVVTYSGLGTLPIAIIAAIGAFFITASAGREAAQAARPATAAAAGGGASVSDDVASDDPELDFE